MAEDNAAADAAAVAISGKGKKKKSAAPVAGAIDWVTLRNACLVTMERVLTIPANYLWAMGSIHENYLSVVWQYIVKILESKPAGIKAATGGYEKDVRSRCISIVAVCVKHFGSPESSGSYSNLISCLLEALMRSEHMCAVTAETCQSCVSIITREFLEEISSINEGATKAASSGMKNIGIFIEDLAKYNYQHNDSQSPGNYEASRQRGASGTIELAQCFGQYRYCIRQVSERRYWRERGCGECSGGERRRGPLG